MSIQHGFLLIADITGYTMYLNQSELEHAQDILQSLLELLIEHTRPPLVISRLAGDAVISYGLQPGFISGQVFVEILEDTYVAFRKAINLMVLNTSCRCNACANIGGLDLKFFVHYGTFALQKLDAHSELVGADVNLIHRLLKNRVKEHTGIRAYSLYTEAAVDQLGIDNIAETMVPHQESYEDVGEVSTWIQDMHPIWMQRKSAERIDITAEAALYTTETDLPVPLNLAWEILTLPEYRALLMHSERQEIKNLKSGRVGQGSAYHCYHGNGRVTTQTILEWIPLEQLTTEDTTPVPQATVLTILRLTPLGEKTNLRVVVSRARGPFLSRVMCDLVGRFIMPATINAGIAALHNRLDTDLASGALQIPEHNHPPEAHLKAEIAAELQSAG